MKHLDAPAHTRGEAAFVDDLPEPRGLLHAAVFASPVAHGTVLSLDTTKSLTYPGVVGVFTAADIPGANQIGGMVQDEPLLADGGVHFVGQPVAVVVAESRHEARVAVTAIEAEFERLPPVFDPRGAAAAGHFIVPSRTLERGDVEATWASCSTVVEGRVESGGQEHLYLETQGAMAVPIEGGRIRLLSATQAPTAVQRIAARVLDMPMNAFEVEVTRLGGAFGGKEDQATPWAVIAALGVAKLGRPVKLVLSRHEDNLMTGKRHPYSSDFKLGLAEDGTILAYEAIFYQNAGAAADLSPAILERSLFHATGSYFIPNVRVTGHSCRTNLPPFTAMRGFGAPQAMFVIESAIARAADTLGIDAGEIQRANLLSEGDVFPYGMRVAGSQARRSYSEAEQRCRLPDLKRQIRSFNRDHRLVKRGVATMPVCFGISFTSTFLNQAAALVHVYTDGSISVSTGAVEMGQGVNTKIAGIAAHTLGLSNPRIRIETTNTTRVANTSPTAASSGADMNGRAVEIACGMILDRLLAVAAQRLDTSAECVTIHDDAILLDGRATDLGWDQLVWHAYSQRISLTAQAHYATPGIWYDREREQGEPFAYHVFGTAVVEATVDCLRGTATIDRVRMVHDAGRPLNEVIDRGQAEGGLLQGIGWMTMEELLFDDGHNISNTLSTYKVPDLLATPEIEVVFLDDADNPKAVLRSKAIGEPPLMYGIGAYFAIKSAMQAFRRDLPLPFSAPLTSEKILSALYASGTGDPFPEHLSSPAAVVD